MSTTIRRQLPTLFFIIFVGSATCKDIDNNKKLGRCPPLIDSHPEMCADEVNEKCDSDLSCNETEKCCFDGCSQICTQPIYSACEHQLLAAKRGARAMGSHLTCRSDGQFVTVQCDIYGECWCVDEAGFELAGTRTNQTENINCSKPRPCSGLMCRMLCPYGFNLDSNGCPLCQCRDPCSGVTCPGSQKCHLEEVVCDSEPCPPIPSCKQARFLDTICPAGEPLYLNEESQPFLCGIEENKPQCPPFFTCIVHEHMDYGACCPSLDKITKPGKCPIDSNDTFCGEKCNDDASCMGLLKCCPSSKCGSHCVPSNSTACEQQRLLAELLSRNEKSDRGYVPECDQKGDFNRKQCSRNGLICWCVDLKGNKLAKTMGPSSNVTCSNDLLSNTECDEIMCHTFCEYGTKLDSKGCSTCDCADPCDGFFCLEGEQCVTSFSDSCIGTFCPSTPECKNVTEQTNKPGICPQTEICVNDSKTCINDDNCEEEEKCCPHTCGSSCMKPLHAPPRLPTMCEYLRAYALSVVDSPVSRNLAYPAPQCTKQGLFEPIQCANGICWCVDEFGIELPSTRGSNKDVVDCTIAEGREGCLGLMCRLGCDYGFVRDENRCPICECRDPCDVIDCPENTHCQMIEVEETCSGGFCPPVPQCVYKDRSLMECPVGDAIINPKTNETWICNSLGECPQNYSCNFADSVDISGVCCSERGNDVCELPKDAGSCESMVQRWFYNTDTSRCESFVFGGCEGNLNNFMDRDDCEKSCVVNVNSPPKEGVCPVVADDEVGTCAEECRNDVDCTGPQKCCLNGCGAHVCRDPAGSNGKPGQCPYLLSKMSENCELECKSDFDCSGDSKCCSNGCGLSCVQSLNKTACQHMRIVAQDLLEKTPEKEIFVPSCVANDGQFDSVQCFKGKCWCVHESGIEIVGTRMKGQPNCSAPRICPVADCQLNCQFGLQLDSDGCPTCACHDPCTKFTCTETEECRVVTLKCSSGQCPPIPMCLPKLKNPCGTGEVARDAMTGQIIHCGSQGEMCPSSHKCHLSPLEEFAVCCPKSSDVCSQPQDPGLCMAAIPRWSFHSPTNTCQEFTYGGCGGNLNNFQTQADCRFVCPVLSSCEQVREKNKKLMSLFNRDIFIPKCNSFSGAWEPIQCLPSLGLCWCVNRDGEQIAGSMVRGVPQCSARVGRQFAETNISSICKSGENVHVCDLSVCEKKVCLSDTTAVCQIDPCNGCTPKFYNSTGQEINCEEGLSPCQIDLMRVMNSKAWANIDITLPVAIMKDLPIINTDVSTRKKRDLVANTFALLRSLVEEPVMSEERLSPEETKKLTTLATTIDSLPELPLEALLIGVTLPQCTDDGQYSPTQTTGVLSWCLTKDGQPIDKSISRGDIECSQNGEILEKDESLEVCPNSQWKPRVCKDECLTSYCPAHPDAVCLADPCNNCKVSFYSKKGDPLTCDEKCSQPQVVGVCRASYRRYFYNQTSEQCEEFTYGGCGGNDNNFVSMEECVTECNKPTNICEQPKRVGMCRASMRRWYFNQLSDKCEEFIYGGCDGNENNFETREECQARCPDLVLCPHSNLLDLMTPCSRRSVCNGVVCHGRDDVVCTVDPCNNCSLKFVDLDGNDAICDVGLQDIVTPKESDKTNVLAPYVPLNKKTRCQKEQMAAKTWSERVPTCDGEGRFEPTQCEDLVCWCVDQAGNALPDDRKFSKGTEICPLRQIELVRVKLVFKLESRKDLENKLVKEAIGHILRHIEAITLGDVIVELESNTVVIQFVLIGDNKVDVAYALEEMLKYGLMRLMVGEEILRAVPSSSSFYHELADFHQNNSFHFSTITVAAVLVFTFLTLLLICALIGGVMVYRKKRMGTYPRGSLESLASSTSPIFGYDTKIPIGSNYSPFTLDKKLKVKTIENEYAVLNVKQPEKKYPLA